MKRGLGGIVALVRGGLELEALVVLAVQFEVVVVGTLLVVVGWLRRSWCLASRRSVGYSMAVLGR